MGVRLLALLEEQLRLNLQLLELARENGRMGEASQEGLGLEEIERLTRYWEEREGLLGRIGLLQETAAHRREEIEISSLPPEVEAVCRRIAATVQEILELDHSFQQTLIEWQEGVLEGIKGLQEAKKALAAYKPAGGSPPRFFDGKV